MNNQHFFWNNNKLGLGTVKAKVDSLPVIGLSEGDKYWYDNRIYVRDTTQPNGWFVIEPRNGLNFMLETGATGGHTYICYNGYFQDITLGSDATTVNGHTIGSDVPPNSKFTDTTYSAGENITIDENNVISATMYDNTTIKQDILDLQADSHTHSNETSLDKIGEDTSGNFLFNGSKIQAEIPIATSTQVGVVKPDGTTTTVSADGTLSVIGGSSGTTDYSALINKPKINNVELAGNKTLTELGVQPSGDYANSVHAHTIADVTGLQTELNNKLSSVPSEYVNETELNETLVPYLLKTGDTKDNIVTFTEAITDTDIATGDTHTTIFGKILKSIKNLRTGKIDKTSIVQTTAVNDSTKIPSSVVTNALATLINNLSTSVNTNLGTIYISNPVVTSVPANTNTIITTPVSVPAGTYAVIGRTSFDVSALAEKTLAIMHNSDMIRMQINSNSISHLITVPAGSLSLAVYSRTPINTPGDKNLVQLEAIRIK